MRTFSPKQSDITRAWHLIDAEDMVLGRLASEVARLLRGKHKPIYAPHVDTGDFVVIVNAAKIAVDPKKGADKRYYRNSQNPAGSGRRIWPASWPVIRSGWCAWR